MRNRITALLVAGVVLGLVTPPAVAAGLTDVVVPFQSVAGIRVGSTPAQVQSLAGRPSTTFHSFGKIGGQYFDHAHIRVFYDPESRADRSDFVEIVGRRFRTFHGIRSGMAETTVKRRLRGQPNLSCSSGALDDCSINIAGSSGVPHSSQTVFGFAHGKLARMSVNDDGDD